MPDATGPDRLQGKQSGPDWINMHYSVRGIKYRGDLLSIPPYTRSKGITLFEFAYSLVVVIFVDGRLCYRIGQATCRFEEGDPRYRVRGVALILEFGIARAAPVREGFVLIAEAGIQYWVLICSSALL